MENKFLSQVIDSLTRGDVILDLMVTNANRLMGTSRLEAACAAVTMG